MRSDPLYFMLRLLSGVIMLISAALLGYGFFKWSWTEGSNRLTPYQIWIGKDADGKDFTFNMAAYDRPRSRSYGTVGGFDDVRGVDRLLVFIPGGALILGMAGLLYAAQPWLVTRSARAITRTAATTAFWLVLFPFVWQTLSTHNWASFYENRESADLARVAVRTLSNEYDTAEFVQAAVIGLIGALLAIGLEVSVQRRVVTQPEVDPLVGR